jgi:hypothetical protein
LCSAAKLAKTLSFHSRRPRTLLVRGAERDADEHRARRGGAAVAGDQHGGAGGALRERQPRVLGDGQLLAQRDHHQDAQQPGARGDQEDAKPARIETEKEQRRNGEDDAGGERVAGRRDDLHDVVLEHGAAPQEAAQHGHREHRRRDRGGRREPDLQAEVGIDHAEGDRQQRAEHQRARRELGQPPLGGDVRGE